MMGLINKKKSETKYVYRISYFKCHVVNLAAARNQRHLWQVKGHSYSASQGQEV